MTLEVPKLAEMQRSSRNDMLDFALMRTIGHYAYECRSMIIRMDLAQRTYNRRLARLRIRQDAIRDEAYAREHARRQVALEAEKLTKGNMYRGGEGENYAPDNGLYPALQFGRLSANSQGKLRSQSAAPGRRLSLSFQDQGVPHHVLLPPRQTGPGNDTSSGRHSNGVRSCPCSTCNNKVTGKRPGTVPDMRVVDFVKQYSKSAFGTRHKTLH
jgi:hypothetical protein